MKDLEDLKECRKTLTAQIAKYNSLKREYNNILNYYRERAKELYNENYDNWEKERHKRQLKKLKEYQEEHKRGG